MPRPKVDERTRKRINKACLYCQKTKQKCDGLTPCGKCARRNESRSCAYSPHERSYGHRRRRQKPTAHCQTDIRHTETVEANAPAATARPAGSNQLSGTRPSVKESEVTVPGLSQVLYDNKGQIGQTADVSDLSVVEELPPVQDGGLDLYITRNKGELKRLVDVFFISSFYQQGRRLALLELTNNPTTETIQAFTLISIYMLGCSWRNGASLNLGIAISAAKSLGYHQDTTNSAYDMKERHRRAQVWKTLHYHDLFFSAMMGRSSSTSNTDSTAVDDGDPNREILDDEFNQSLSMTESLRAFLIIERAVNKVYTKETVSLGILQSLTRELQEKSINLAKAFYTPADDTRYNPEHVQQLNLRNAHVSCSYYFAMMLLTRPFLITSLRAKSSMEHVGSGQSHGLNNNGVGGSISSEIFSGAMTCIDSATYTVQLLHELLTANMLFNNMPFIV
ncbi:predicted protein [Aspergillus terreus NIH2624]|uniref:Zn(2)-C6 fungal-type domain-containing protein n=1 Tax=Aspergillus terreus (strain NIH 2624 / FGSC A1156) TaxID=341663 RepID=Q0CI74_ASPTN|nr:uncharacterized protein ATEG_06610 [Aspergillus terreus NIH2624]EAU33154.1 predicted protein [Aspergillus terreus NIH2624]